MTEESIDLIRLEGEGNSVVLQLTERAHQQGPGATDVLTGKFLVDTPFVRGSIEAWIFPKELRNWQDALDALDAGQNICWREASRGPKLFIERDPEDERVRVTVRDTAMSLTTVIVTVPLHDTWFDDAYRRLDLVCEKFGLSDS